jgi:hypothetical protein
MVRPALIVSTGLYVIASAPAADPVPDRAVLLKESIGHLIRLQDPDGQWGYEGVYRVAREIPVGYKIGGTAIVADTLLHAAPDDPAAKAAIAKAVPYILKLLDDPQMVPSTKDAYDVRIWGHAFALDFFCHLRAAKAAGEHAKKVEEWIPKLVDVVVTEEIPGGGWNYANHRQPASFVTAPVAQAMLLARSQGEKVPDEILTRARTVLEKGRTPDGAFAYSGAGSAERQRNGDKPAGSAARSAGCEVTLTLLGGGSPDAVRGAVEAFFTHWDELRKRHQQTGTHVPPYMIAPYYFFYGHRYAAQAMELLPEKDRQKERDRLLATILKTRDADGTWNDRVFARSKGYGTAMCVVALTGDKAPVVPKFEPKK